MLNKLDIFDEDNRPTGRLATITEAVQNNYWRRAIHLTVVTETGYALIEKRSETIIGHPGKLEITCGGYVDAGEAPEHAAVREFAEEVGLAITPDQLIKVTNQRWPRVNERSHTFVYNWAVVLPDHLADISNVQAEEVAWAKFITLDQAQQLIKNRELAGLGQLKPGPNAKNLEFALSQIKQPAGSPVADAVAA
jgi:8-oxo-dGTP pyrophosphatase MutT (NUDIX family)